MLAAATTPNSKASKDVSLDTGFGFGCGQRIGGEASLRTISRACDSRVMVKQDASFQSQTKIRAQKGGGGSEKADKEPRETGRGER